MARDLRLVEDDVLFRVNARGDKGGGHFADVLGELAWVLPHGDGVQIDDTIEAFMAFL